MAEELGADRASLWASIVSISDQFGCSPETLHNWVQQPEHNVGKRAGPSTDERERIKALECENQENRQTNEILRKAPACFALDRRQCGIASSDD